MNLLNKFVDYILGEKVIPYDEFVKQLDDKLIEYGYKRNCGICVADYSLFYFGNKASNCVFFQIDKVSEQVNFVNNEKNNPSGGWTTFDKEKFTKTNLNFLFEKASTFAKLSKKCVVMEKLASINKDFE